MTTKTRIAIRKIQRSDLDDIMEIEQSNSAFSNPVEGMWVEEDFREVLSHASCNGIVVVNKSDQTYQVIGFAIYSRMPDSIYICNLAVHPDFSRSGIGSDLLDTMKTKLKDRRILEIDVRESNLDAQLFLKNNQFLAVKVLPSWYEYPNPVEDAYKFQYSE